MSNKKHPVVLYTRRYGALWAPTSIPPLPPPSLPLAQSKNKKNMAAILDFEVDVKLIEVDVKNMTEGREGGKGRGPGSVFYVDVVIILHSALM